jgi:hypothetical protein
MQLLAFGRLVGPAGRWRAMARRSTSTTPRHAGVTGAAPKGPGRPSIVHSSMYLPEPVYEALRKMPSMSGLKSTTWS